MFSLQNYSLILQPSSCLVIPDGKQEALEKRERPAENILSRVLHPTEDSHGRGSFLCSTYGLLSIFTLAKEARCAPNSHLAPLARSLLSLWPLEPGFTAYGCTQWQEG